MKTIILDGMLIETKKDLYDAFRQQLPTEDLIGNNLDALHDVLSSMTEPVEAELVNEDLLREHLGGYVDRILLVMEKACEEI